MTENDKNHRLVVGLKKVDNKWKVMAIIYKKEIDNSEVPHAALLPKELYDTQEEAEYAARALGAEIQKIYGVLN